MNAQEASNARLVLTRLDDLLLDTDLSFYGVDPAAHERPRVPVTGMGGQDLGAFVLTDDNTWELFTHSDSGEAWT